MLCGAWGDAFPGESASIGAPGSKTGKVPTSGAPINFKSILVRQLGDEAARLDSLTTAAKARTRLTSSWGFVAAETLTLFLLQESTTLTICLPAICDGTGNATAPDDRLRNCGLINCRLLPGHLCQ
jgi:hypothetical protein